MVKRLLDFKDTPVQELTLAELKETIDERNIGGNPISGVIHFVLLERIKDMIEKSGIEYQMQPIYATSGGASAFPGVTRITALEEKYGVGSLQSHVLRRMITAFNLLKGETAETSQSIAVAYHQQGIQVAFGPNIKICRNQCIYGSSNRFQTFGDNKMNLEDLLTKVYYWLGNYDELRKRDLAILDGMKNIILSYANVCDLIGELNLYRVAKDQLRLRPEYILQQNQIGDLSVRYLEFLKVKDNKLDYNKSLSLYEFYNMCTEMYKPEHTDLPNIIGRNHLLGDYLIDKFELIK
jgi:hypothetical protein